jgi:hypothetical protein
MPRYLILALVFTPTGGRARAQTPVSSWTAGLANETRVANNVTYLTASEDAPHTV